MKHKKCVILDGEYRVISKFTTNCSKLPEGSIVLDDKLFDQIPNDLSAGPHPRISIRGGYVEELYPSQPTTEHEWNERKKEWRRPTRARRLVRRLTRVVPELYRKKPHIL